MKIIVVYGTANSGKSTTLRKFYDKDINGNNKFIVKLPKAEDKTMDYQAVVEYCGHTIGIFTWGDNEKNVKGAVTFAEENGCGILICAARSSGKGYQYLDGMDCPQVWIEKGRFDGDGALSDGEVAAIRDIIAEQTADYIYQSIQLLCK